MVSTLPHVPPAHSRGGRCTSVFITTSRATKPVPITTGFCPARANGLLGLIALSCQPQSEELTLYLLSWRARTVVHDISLRAHIGDSHVNLGLFEFVGHQQCAN